MIGAMALHERRIAARESVFTEFYDDDLEHMISRMAEEIVTLRKQPSVTDAMVERACDAERRYGTRMQEAALCGAQTDRVREMLTAALTETP